MTRVLRLLYAWRAHSPPATPVTLITAAVAADIPASPQIFWWTATCGSPFQVSATRTCWYLGLRKGTEAAGSNDTEHKLDRCHERNSSKWGSRGQYGREQRLAR